MRRANPVHPALIAIPVVLVVVGAVVYFTREEPAKKKPAPPGGLGAGAGLFGRPGILPPLIEEEVEEPCQEGWHRSAVTGQCLPPRAPFVVEEDPPPRAPLNRARAGTKTQSGGHAGTPGTTEKLFDILPDLLPGQAPSTVRQDADVPNVKGDDYHGYNYNLYTDLGLPVQTLRWLMTRLKYDMQDTANPHSTKILNEVEQWQVEQFQNDWNAVVKALDKNKMGASGSAPFFKDMRGLLEPTGSDSTFSNMYTTWSFPKGGTNPLDANEKATLRAIEIADIAQTYARDNETESLEWQSLVAMS